MLAIILGAIGITIGTVTDLRTHEVPDWVNFGMLTAGIGLAVLSSAWNLTWTPILMSLAGLALGYGVGALMYYTGQWGGGDAKMMMGLGALLGLPVAATGWLAPPLFITFLIFTIFAGALYGLAWMVGLMITHRKKFFKALKKRIHTPKMLKIRIAVIILAVIIAAIGFLFPTPITIVFIVLAALTYLTFYLSLAAKTVEEVCFVQKRAVAKLVEGDWLIDDVKKGKKIIVKADNGGIKKEQIEALKKANIKAVVIKEGIPFVPSFAIAYAFALYWFLNALPLVIWG